MLGVLQVGSPDVDAFGPAEVGLVEALAHQAAIAIQNARLIEAIAASREEVRRRARASRPSARSPPGSPAIRDPADLLKQVVDASRDLLDADRAELDLIEPDTGLVRLAHVSGDGDLNRPGPDRLGGVPGDRGINGLAIAHRRAVATGDYLTDDRFTHTDDFDTFVAESGIHSVVVAPLFTDDGLLGVIKVSAQDRDAYDDEDAALMEAFADQATVAIQNARLIEELGRSREEISRRADAERALREIARTSRRSATPDAVLQQTVDEARRLLESDGARIDLLEGDTLTWAYASGATSTETRAEGRDLTFKVGEGVAGIAGPAGPDVPHRRLPRRRALPPYRPVGRARRADRLCLGPGRTDARRARLAGLDLRQQPPDRRLRRGERAAAPGACRPGRDHDPERPPDRRAEPLPDPSSGGGPRRSRACARSPPGSRRRRAPEDVLQRTVDEAARLLAADEARIDLIDADSGLLKWAYHSSASTPYGSWEWPDNPDEKIEQGISGPGRPRGPRGMDRRLPQRSGLHPRQLVGPLRQGDRHQLGDVGAAPRRRPVFGR
jgi:GAF domain-containing protein